jgi:hypothetical protein
MSQILNENDDNRSVANSDQQGAQQPQNTESARNYDNELKEHKWMIANLEVFGQGESSPMYICILNKGDIKSAEKYGITQNKI